MERKGSREITCTKPERKYKYVKELKKQKKPREKKKKKVLTSVN